MALQFIGDAAIYVPKLDAIKVTAINSGTAIHCFVKRSALVALGCKPAVDAATMLSVFDKNRSKLERSAEEKFANGADGHIVISAGDVLKESTLRRRIGSE
jgi:hypothetical protein